ncbi:MAG: FIST C-terminal domain-containing protein [Succinivibrionaceae bacterium]|nr:FIST C-terminal domain-containing protein [Succinivibrionaceae bacterium]
MLLDSCTFFDSDPAIAAGKLVDRIKSHGANPDMLLIFSSYPRAGETIRSAIVAQLPGITLLGVSSELGVCSSDPATFADIPCMSAMIFFDPEGAYGIASGTFGSNDQQELSDHIDLALKRAGRRGEIPDLVFFVFGQVLRQQLIISSFESLFGRSVPIFGGGAGICGSTMGCFTHKAAYVDEDFYALVLMYPSCQVRTSYTSFFRTMPYYGVISSTEGNRILQIDNRSALDVYTGWLANSYPRDFLDGQENMLQEVMNVHPLGVQTGLSHLDSNYRTFVITETTAGGALRTYTHLKPGTRVHFMAPFDRETTLQKYRESIECTKLRRGCSQTYGILTVTCYIIRSMLAGTDVEFLRNLDFPICGFFSRGEHGQFSNGVNTDSNLMVASVVFCQED